MSTVSVVACDARGCESVGTTPRRTRQVPWSWRRVTVSWPDHQKTFEVCSEMCGAAVIAQTYDEQKEEERA